MRASRLLLACFAGACCANAASASSLDAWVMFTSVDSTNFRSVGSATYYDDLNARGSAALSGEHRVSQNSPTVSFVTPVQGNGSYYYALEGPTIPSACYDTSIHAVSEPAGITNSRLEQTSSGTTR